MTRTTGMSVTWHLCELRDNGQLRDTHEHPSNDIKICKTRFCEDEYLVKKTTNTY